MRRAKVSSKKQGSSKQLSFTLDANRGEIVCNQQSNLHHATNLIVTQPPRPIGSRRASEVICSSNLSTAELGDRGGAAVLSFAKVRNRKKTTKRQELSQRLLRYAQKLTW